MLLIFCVGGSLVFALVPCEEPKRIVMRSKPRTSRSASPQIISMSPWCRRGHLGRVVVLDATFASDSGGNEVGRILQKIA